MPSSVAATISSSVCGPGSRPTLVIRTIGSRAQPSERTQPASASPATDAESRPASTPTQRPVAHGVARRRRRALVVEAERAERAGDRRVDRDVHQLRAVLQRAELSEVEPARAGVGGLPAEDAVELDGVADRLVDLQRHLLAAEDQRRLAARARWRRQQRPRLVGHPGGVGVEVDLVDQLPAAGAVLATRGRVGAALRLAVADRRGHDPGAALADPLVDPVALARHEPLGGVPAPGTGPRRRRRRARPSSPSPRRAGRPCRTARHRADRSRSRSPTIRSPPSPGAARASRGRPRHWRQRSRRPARRPPAPTSRQVGDGEEPPARPDQGAHAEPGVLRLDDVLDAAVAGGHRLVAAVHHPGVGVARPASSAACTAAAAASNSVTSGQIRRSRFSGRFACHP